MKKCLSPSTAYVCGTIVSQDGVVSPHLVFSFTDAAEYYSRIYGGGCACDSAVMLHEISVPCGKCAACSIRKRKEMSTRLVHETSMHEKCCFITLTYDDEHLPIINGDSTLVVSDVQCFMKRLRRHLTYRPRKPDGRDYCPSIRYFAVGEYGSKTHRPHYHILVFGWTPSDKSFLKQRGRIVSYRSSQLEKLWKFGFSMVEDVSPYVAKYCARYVTKKYSTSWIPSLNQLPEFTLSSKMNGGIGAPWFDKFGDNACANHFCTYRVGDLICKATVPTYYWNRLRKRNQPLWIRCRDERLEWIRQNPGSTSSFDDILLWCEVHAYNDKRRTENEVL